MDSVSKYNQKCNRKPIKTFVALMEYINSNIRLITIQVSPQMEGCSQNYMETLRPDQNM
jgi:hypothetical protein